MFKKIYTCDCLLDVAHCLEFGADFDCFKKKCLEQNKDTSIIYAWSYLMFVVCCKNVVDFQIDLYVIENSVPLRSVICNNA